MKINIVRHFIRWISTLSSISSGEDQHCRAFHPMKINIVKHFIRWISILSNISCAGDQHCQTFHPMNINIVDHFMRWTALLRTSCNQDQWDYWRKMLKEKDPESTEFGKSNMLHFWATMFHGFGERTFVYWHQEHLWYKDFYLSKIWIFQIEDGH